MALDLAVASPPARKRGVPPEVLRPLPRGFSVSLERPIQVAVAAIALLGLPKLIDGFPGATEPAYLVVGLSIVLAVHVLIVAAGASGRRFGLLIVSLTVVGTAIIVIGQFLEGPAHAGYWRTDAWFGTVFAYGILLRGRRKQLAVLIVTIVIGFLLVLIAKDLDWGSQIRSFFYTVSGVGVLVLGRLATIAIADEYLASRQDRAEKEEHAIESRARAGALASLRREMHDSLLHALHRMSATWSAATVEEIRSSCAEARQRIAQMPEPLSDEKMVDVCALLHRTIKTRRQVITCEPEILLVPDPVAQAVVGAAREAVRNALKHTSGIPEVRLVQRGGVVRVSISDDGPGFDVNAPRGQSLGLDGSILQRMASVGGRALVESSDEGTTVELVWPAPPPHPDGVNLRARTLLALLPWPLVVASVIHILTLDWPGAAFPLTISLIVAALIAVSAIRVRSGGLTAWQATVLCAVAVMTFAVNYAAVQGPSSNEWDLWSASLVAALLIISVPGQPVRVAVPLAHSVLVCCLAISWITLGWQATIGSHFPGILAVLLYTLVTLVLSVGTRVVSRHLHVTRKLAAAAELRAMEARVRDGVWHGWLERAEALTGDFLTEVVDGTRHPFDEDTRERATRLGARLRDELRLWPGSLALASTLDNLRAAGWDACLLNADLPAVDDELFALLDGLPAPPSGQGQVRILVERGGGTVTVTPGLALPDDATLRRWVSVADPDFTQFVTGKER